MKIYMLITVINREILTETFPTLEKAQKQMKIELLNNLNKSNYRESDYNIINFGYENDYLGLGDISAYSNYDIDYLCDWRIVSLDTNDNNCYII